MRALKKRKKRKKKRFHERRVRLLQIRSLTRKLAQQTRSFSRSFILSRGCQRESLSSIKIDQFRVTMDQTCLYSHPMSIFHIFFFSTTNNSNFHPTIIVIIFRYVYFTFISRINIELDENIWKFNFYSTKLLANKEYKISTIFLRSSLFFFPFNTSARTILDIYRDNLDGHFVFVPG